jgi:hypothetical protein
VRLSHSASVGILIGGSARNAGASNAMKSSERRGMHDPDQCPAASRIQPGARYQQRCKMSIASEGLVIPPGNHPSANLQEPRKMDPEAKPFGDGGEPGRSRGAVHAHDGDPTAAPGPVHLLWAELPLTNLRQGLVPLRPAWPPGSRCTGWTTSARSAGPMRSRLIPVLRRPLRLGRRRGRARGLGRRQASPAP